jgi:hypothetical protein
MPDRSAKICCELSAVTPAAAAAAGAHVVLSEGTLLPTAAGFLVYCMLEKGRHDKLKG